MRTVHHACSHFTSVLIKTLFINHEGYLNRELKQCLQRLSHGDGSVRRKASWYGIRLTLYLILEQTALVLSIQKQPIKVSRELVAVASRSMGGFFVLVCIKGYLVVPELRISVG